jgi:hypothetical protein
MDRTSSVHILLDALQGPDTDMNEYCVKQAAGLVLSRIAWHIENDFVWFIPLKKRSN